MGKKVLWILGVSTLWATTYATFVIVGPALGGQPIMVTREVPVKRFLVKDKPLPGKPCPPAGITFQVPTGAIREEGGTREVDGKLYFTFPYRTLNGKHFTMVLGPLPDLMAAKMIIEEDD